MNWIKRLFHRQDNRIVMIVELEGYDKLVSQLTHLERLLGRVAKKSIEAQEALEKVR